MKTVAASSKRPLLLRIWGFIYFLYAFFRELVLANIHLARLVLSPERRDSIVPGFIFYPVDHLSKLEILVLSHCITLTPGSATVEVSKDFSMLTIHILDTRTSEAMVRSIKNDLEAPLLGWTR